MYSIAILVWVKELAIFAPAPANSWHIMMSERCAAAWWDWWYVTERWRESFVWVCVLQCCLIEGCFNAGGWQVGIIIAICLRSRHPDWLLIDAACVVFPSALVILTFITVWKTFAHLFCFALMVYMKTQNSAQLMRLQGGSLVCKCSRDCRVDPGFGFCLCLFAKPFQIWQFWWQVQILYNMCCVRGVQMFCRSLHVVRS